MRVPPYTTMSSILAPSSTVGRKKQPIRYVHTVYSGNNYTVGILHSGAVFVIDAEDFERIEGFSWHKTAENYISCAAIVDGVRRVLYLHNLIMGRLTWSGKGQTETIDHINRNGFDNRKANLRLVSQTEQNLNQRKKPRHVILPVDCGIAASDIPRHIWYVRPNGLHGDRFAIEFKTEGIKWRTTSSKSVALCDKLAEAKAKLAEFYTLYPYLDPDNPAILAERATLTLAYNTIVEAALAAA
jgi:hypothetical protein